MSTIFQSLRSHNYRLWAAGALVSNVGTWMQRIRQEWLVLTVLPDHNATAVGIVMTLQFRCGGRAGDVNSGGMDDDVAYFGSGCDVPAVGAALRGA